MTPAEGPLVASGDGATNWSVCWHTNETGEFFLYAGVAVVRANVHECPVLWKLVDDFVATVGKGVIRDLIIDRGFIDGAGHRTGQTGVLASKRPSACDATWMSTATRRRDRSLPDTAWQGIRARRNRSSRPSNATCSIPATAEPIASGAKPSASRRSRANARSGACPSPLPPSQWIAKIERRPVFEGCPVRWTCAVHPRQESLTQRTLGRHDHGPSPPSRCRDRTLAGPSRNDTAISNASGISPRSIPGLCLGRHQVVLYAPDLLRSSSICCAGAERRSTRPPSRA